MSVCRDRQTEADNKTERTRKRERGRGWGVGVGDGGVRGTSRKATKINETK